MGENNFKNIPYPYCQLFTNFGKLTQVQCAFFNDVLYSDKSIVLCAPTGSGKTVAFELGIVQLLLQHPKSANSEQLKAVYVAPLKSICSEIHNSWSGRFQSIGVKCIQLTGDSDVVDQQEVQEAQIIVTTPEKWDMITRAEEYRDVLKGVRLFMIDEVHLLDDNVRGPIIEVIVSRMKMIQPDFRSPLRFIIASATIPNIEDIAVWIGSSMNVIKLLYTEEDRPVRLQKHIIGVQSKYNGFKFDMGLNYKLANIIRKYSAGKSTMIFCNCRKSTEMAAAVLAKQTDLLQLNSLEKESLLEISQRFSDTKLREAFVHGIAFHHAGMTYEDRSIIEDSFRKLLLKVLLCTNTLAMGVNLPVHLVIVKSTEYYDRGSLREYSATNLLQMIGRAGRLGYDTAGISVILTQYKHVRKYENLMLGKCFIESHLHRRLAEYLNAEVALRTIGDLPTAMTWLRSTYLYVRMSKNPKHYGMQEFENNDDLDRSIEKLCVRQLEELERIGLIAKDSSADVIVQATARGEIMAKFYMSLNTMQTFGTLRGDESYLDLIALISRCQEFSEFILRVGDKKPLNAINKSVRFPLKGLVKTREDKIFCLMQAELGCLRISSPALVQEAAKIVRIGKRLAKCLAEFIRASENSFCSGCYSAMLHAVTISKCFHANLWENSAYVSKQLRRVGVVYSSALVDAGKTTLKSISETDARSIERILNESHPFGEEVVRDAQSFPRYMVELRLRSADSLELKVIQINTEYSFDEPGASLIVGDSSNNLLLYIENVDDVIQKNSCLEQVITALNKSADTIYAHLVHNSIVGVDECISVNLNDLSRTTSHCFKKNSLESSPNLPMVEVKNRRCLPNRNSKVAHNLKGRSLKWKLNRFSFAKSKISACRPILSEQKKIVAEAPLVQSKVTSFFEQRKKGRCPSFNRNNRINNFGAVMLDSQPKATESVIKTKDFGCNVTPTNSNENNCLNVIESNAMDLSVSQCFPTEAPYINLVNSTPKDTKNVSDPKDMCIAYNSSDINNLSYIIEDEAEPLNLTVPKPTVSKTPEILSPRLEQSQSSFCDDKTFFDLVRERFNENKNFVDIFDQAHKSSNSSAIQKENVCDVKDHKSSNSSFFEKENLGDVNHYNYRPSVNTKVRNSQNGSRSETRRSDFFPQDCEQFRRTSATSTSLGKSSGKLDDSKNGPEKSFRAINPYRLQIMPTHRYLNSTQVTKLNENMMSYVLEKKCEYNNK